MNGTELKTLRQSLFLSVAEAAALHQVRERVYRYWESGDWVVPDDVAARMERLDDAADEVAINESAVEYALTTVLIRYASDEDLWTMDKKGPRIPAAVHAAGIDRARRDIGTNYVRIVTMDRDAYQAWLTARGETDSHRNRQDWAATVTDPPTRAGKAAQASGEEKTAPTSGEGGHNAAGA